VLNTLSIGKPTEPYSLTHQYKRTPTRYQMYLKQL